MDTPVSLMLKLTDAAANSFLLESVTGGEIRGRYSVIGCDPDLIWRCRGHSAEINRQAATDPDAFAPETKPSLDSLRALIAESRIDLPRELPPMAAGLFGYLGYDMIRLVEKLPEPNPDPLGLPDATLLRPRLVAIVDNVRDQVTLVAPVWHDQATGAEAAYRTASDRLTAAHEAIDRAPAHGTPVTAVSETAARAIAPVSNTTHDEFLAKVEKAKDYIRAGDVFQVVPSQRWALPLDVSPFSLYRAIRRINPSPYLFFFNPGSFQIVGASPEIMVRVRGGKVTIRPIAGTRRRRKIPEDDKALEEELLAHPTERDEHLMLIDLGRNDVGRVAKIGTFDPNEQCTVER
jgi:anthranilate synthase component 1